MRWVSLTLNPSYALRKLKHPSRSRKLRSFLDNWLGPGAMPTISWFYGIAIRMYVRDHPPQHFHAVYGEYEAFVTIETGEVIEGSLPRAAARLVQEWALAHRDELRENWRRARAGEQPEKIAGLDAD